MTLSEKDFLVKKLINKWENNGNIRKTKFLFKAVAALRNINGSSEDSRKDTRLIKVFNLINIMIDVLNAQYKDNWDFKEITFGSMVLYIYFPEIEIQNDFGEKYKLKSSIVRIPIILNIITSSITFKQITFARTSFTKAELEKEYLHSHTDNRQSGWITSYTNFCEGNSIYAKLKKGEIKIEDKRDYFDLLFISLKDLISYESTAGVYYKTFSDLLTRRKVTELSLFSKMYLKEFLKEIVSRDTPLEFWSIKNNDKHSLYVRTDTEFTKNMNEIAKETPNLYGILVREISGIDYEPFLTIPRDRDNHMYLKNRVDDYYLQRVTKIGKNDLKLKIHETDLGNNVADDISTLKVSDKVLKKLSNYINLIINKNDTKGRCFRNKG